MSARPYSPSWLDRLTDAVGRLPGPAALYYLAIGVVLVLARTIIAWGDGSYPVGTFFPVHVIDGLIPVYFLFAIHVLDDLARRAMADFRPRLRGGEAEYEALTYRLTTMPMRTSLVIGILAAAEGAIYIPLLLSPVDIEASHYLTSPTAFVADTVLSSLAGVFMITFGFHTFRQLWLISRIYTRHTDVSIFDVAGLYALSRVTAVTAVALLFFTYIYFAFYLTDGSINSVVNGIAVGLIVLGALLAFVVPLWGAHRLIQRTKNDRQSEIARRIETASDAIHGRTDAGEYAGAGDIKDTLDALLLERGVVAKASTWPWEPDAVRAVLTAVLLPILIWIVTRILERFGI
ncbi:MAG: hypothetical protein ABIQ01_07745 [Pseudolysinimonas sp.]